MICPVVAYAPSAATNPSMAIQPLNFSASGVIVVLLFKLLGVKVTRNCEWCKDLFGQKMPGITQPVNP